MLEENIGGPLGIFWLLRHFSPGIFPRISREPLTARWKPNCKLLKSHEGQNARFEFRASSRTICVGDRRREYVCAADSVYGRHISAVTPVTFASCCSLSRGSPEQQRSFGKSCRR